jgi:hypothetical protein
MQPWSYSHLDKFETCAKQFYHVRVARDVVEPPTVHTSWGHEVHSALEERIINGTHLPESMERWEHLAAQVEDLPGTKQAEIKMAIAADFQPTDWDNAWSRGVIDLLVLTPTKAAVIDWKTGKFKPSEQIELYVAYTFAHYPQLEEISGVFVWLKDRKLSISNYKRKTVPDIWQSILPRVARLEAAYENDNWPAKPSGLCNGWCPVKSCQYWKERR